jgi:hypothetical protein
MKKVISCVAILACVASSALAQMLDDMPYANIQSCINAAAASTTATCVVPTGTTNTSQVEMASGVTLEFSSGTFTNTNPGGGVFIHFALGVTGATVKGQGVAMTVLRNNSSGAQFGAVVQDEGTGNTISDMTLNGNSNTTGILILRHTSRGRYQNLYVIQNTAVAVAKIVSNGVTATVTCSANCFPPNGFASGKLVRIAGNSVATFNNQFITNGAGTNTFTFASATNSIGTGGFVMAAFINSGIDVEGGTEPQFSNIECSGGPQDCFALVTEDLGSNWGNIAGGRYSNIYTHDSPGNGFSLNALGAIVMGKTITGITVNGLRSMNNGLIGSGPAGADDMSCVALVSNLTAGDHTSISGVTMNGIEAKGCGGPGVRLKGRVTKSRFSGTVTGNGLRQTLGDGQAVDGVVLLAGADVGPTYNHFTFTGDKGGGANVFKTDASTSGNIFTLASGDPVSLGTTNDSGTEVNSAGDVAVFGSATKIRGAARFNILF